MACGNQKGRETKEQERNVPLMLAAINQKLDSLLVLRETVIGIESSIQMMSAQYKELLALVESQDSDLKELKMRMQKIEQTEAGSIEEVKTLRNEVNELEWRSRRLNLEIHGVPFAENENLLAKVNSVAKMLDVRPLETDEIAAIHRLPSKPDKIPGIILRFSQQATRDQWLSKEKKLKRDNDGVYLLENMTKQNKELLWTTKEWAKEKSYQFVWHVNGKILLRRKVGDRAVLIRSVDELQKLE